MQTYESVAALIEISWVENINLEDLSFKSVTFGVTNLVRYLRGHQILQILSTILS